MTGTSAGPVVRIQGVDKVFTSGTATTMERMMVQSAIEIDGSTRVLIILSTGTFEIRETPRSPCSSLPIQVKNCV